MRGCPTLEAWSRRGTVGARVSPHRAMNRFLRRGGGLVGFLLLVYLGVCGYMFLNQASFLYFPERSYDASPAALGMSFEEVRLKAADGVSIAGWWVPAERALGAMVIAHGNGGNMSHRLDKVRLFHEMGFAVLIFDYRGYGASEGKPTEVGTYADMAAAVDHVLTVRRVPASRLALYGESLGGAVAVEEATRRTPAALVLDSTFTSVPAMASHYYPWLPARLLLRFRYDSLSKVPRLKCPVLILHSPEDDIVPYAMGRQLFGASPEPKRFADLVGGHNTVGLMFAPAAQKEMAAFLASVYADP